MLLKAHYIQKAHHVIDFSNLGSEEREMVQTISKAEADYRAQMLYAEKQGLKTGREQGRNEVYKEVIERLKTIGYSEEEA